MKAIILYMMLLAVFGVQNAYSQAVLDRGTPQTHAELMKLAKEIHNAEITGQKELLQKRTAHDFMLCEPSGELVKREAYLALPAPSFNEYGFSLDDVWLLERKDTAVLVYILETSIKLDGKQTNTRQRISDVFNKTPGGWELVSSQRTNISTKSKPGSKAPVKME